MLSTYRGGLGDQEWYAAQTGAVLPDLLAALSIPCKVVSSADEMAATFVDARRTMSSSLHPVSIVMDVRLTTRD